MRRHRSSIWLCLCSATNYFEKIFCSLYFNLDCQKVYRLPFYLFLKIEHFLLSGILIVMFNIQTLKFVNIKHFVLRPPTFSVQTPVLYCFCKVFGFNICRCCKVCNGAAHLQNTIVSTC